MSSPFGHHRTAEVSVRGKNWSDHGGGSSSFQGGSSSHAPGSPRIIPIVRSPVSHLRSLSFPDGPPPKPRRASMSLSRGTVKSVISTASQQDTPSLDSGPYCTIEKGTGHKQPNEQDYDSDDETYEYSLYEPPPNAKKALYFVILK
jgi:hypothetical protein